MFGEQIAAALQQHVSSSPCPMLAIPATFQHVRWDLWFYPCCFGALWRLPHGTDWLVPVSPQGSLFPEPQLMSSRCPLRERKSCTAVSLTQKLDVVRLTCRKLRQAKNLVFCSKHSRWGRKGEVFKEQCCSVNAQMWERQCSWWYGESFRDLGQTGCSIPLDQRLYIYIYLVCIYLFEGTGDRTHAG
jgi:hypothetical protein